MKKLLLPAALLLVFLQTAMLQNQLPCTTVHLEAYADTRADLEQKIKAWIGSNDQTQTRAVVTIPVVVHVVWSQQEENISEEQIKSQIKVLNKDFRRLNVEVPGIPAIFQNIIADVEMEFCLASKDPNGNATNGITRTFTNNSVGIGGSSAIHHSSEGGKDAWDTERYLNIWVAKFAGSVGGVASFPGEGPADEQGVEINYKQFGTINTVAPYHLGRTCTHEIGHYFNLEHPWGPGILDCCEDDFVADTPPACETYLEQCPVHPVFSCGMPDVFMDYMFYTDDACMGMFTNGQKMRMLATLNTVRTGLLDSDACMPVPTSEEERKPEIVVFQNPVRERLSFELKSMESKSWEIHLYNGLGQQCFSKTIETGKHEIPMTDFPNGIYFLMVKNAQYCLTKKIVKE